MKLYRVTQNAGVLERACEDMEITGICTDSRKVTPGCLFIAVEGFKVDGHDFIPGAMAAGAAACLVTKPVPGVPYIRVESIRPAMAACAAEFYGHPERELKVVGVTGTNGKTTTTNLIKHMLEKLGHKCGLIGTNRNMIGSLELPAERTTPESVEIFELMRRMLDEGCDHLLMEVSAHALSLSRVAGIEFECGVFTNLSQDHLDFYGDMDTYFEAKAEMFEHCRSRVFNYDDNYGQRLIKRFGGHTFSAKFNAADLVAKNIRLSEDGVSFQAVMIGGIARVFLGIPGRFSVYNALSAIACGLELGFSLGDLAAALTDCPGVMGRAEVVPVPADYTVMIDYAHSPDSMENVLGAVRGYSTGRLIVLFGCGGDRDRAKRPLMGRAAARYGDILVVTSDNPRSEDPMAIIRDIMPGIEGSKVKVEIIENRIQAIFHALDIARPGDIVALLGKGHETYQEIGGVKTHLDEREVVADYFKSRPVPGC